MFFIIIALTVHRIASAGGDEAERLKHSNEFVAENNIADGELIREIE